MISLILLGLLSVAPPASNTLKPPLQLNPVTDDVVSSRFNYFDLELLQSFSNPSVNHFIAPASIKSVLGMLLEGSVGDTAEEISRLLRIPPGSNSARKELQTLLYDLNDRSESTRLESGNALFVNHNYRVIPQYERGVSQFYKAQIVPVDSTNTIETSKVINDWVGRQTQGLIPAIVTPDTLDPNSIMVLANALYFKGLWKKSFDAQSTALKCFHSVRSACVNAAMMQSTDTFNYKFIEALDAQALEIPYSDGKFSMLVLLPSEKHSVEGLIKDLQHVSFASIVKKLQPVEVLVDFPRFEIEYQVDLKPVLESLGVSSLFSMKANVSGIVQAGNAKISQMIHKTRIEVNEQGTTAAAATGAVVIPLMGSSSPRFFANRPFLFFIYHKGSNNIIFEGRVNQPSEAYDTIFTKPSGHVPTETQARFGGFSARQQAAEDARHQFYYPIQDQHQIVYNS